MLLPLPVMGGFVYDIVNQIYLKLLRVIFSAEGFLTAGLEF